MTIAACVDPADAAKLSESLKRPGARAMTVARGGWRGESAPIGGFWAGRYCTLVTGSPETSADDVEPFARQLAGMQLVYGGEPQMIPSPGPAAPPSAAPPVSPARIADFAPVAGGQVLPPARIERYTDNLYEKIDGKEGMFRAFFFVELRFGQYTQAQAQDYFDTYIYDMAEPVNAFGIYMGERSPSAEPWPIGRDGYVSGCSVYFCKDKYYVNVMGPADGGADKLEISKTIAQSIAATIPDSDQPFPLERYFPAEGRTPNTLKYEATSALGYDFLQQVFIADYKTGEKTYKIFLSQTADAGAARARFDKFVEATAKYDKVLSKAADGEDQIMVGESLGVFTVAFTKGAFFGGVTECEDQTLATKQAEVVRSGLPGLMTGAGGASSAPSDRPVETPVTEQEG